jgi:hypothetical protein
VKRETRRLLRSLLQLVERDVSELRDSHIEVDERCAKVARELAELRAYVYQANLYGIATRDTLLQHIDGDTGAGHSVRVPS